MAHLPRLIAELAGNMLMIVVSLADRALLTATLYRAWGTVVFEQWVSWSAVAALVSVFDLGFGLYFGNRMAIEAERDNASASVRLFEICNFISMSTAVLGFSYAMLSVAFGAADGHARVSEDELSLVLLCAIPALRMVANGPLALYRANRQFAYQLTLVAMGEMGRVIACLAVALAGGRPLTVAATAFIASLTLQIAYVCIDSMRRFEPHRFMIAIPTAKEFLSASAVSFGFLMQNIPILLLANASVILLNRSKTEAGMVAIFVLSRTLTNLPRSLMQSFGCIMGIECARRCVTDDFDGARAVWTRSARILAAASGLAGGLILAAGSELFQVWTGSGDSYNAEYVSVLLLPLVFGVGANLNQNVLVAANTTRISAIGRWTQLLLSALLFWTVPLADAGLRMAVAVSVGEIVGYTPFAIVAMRRLAPRMGLEPELRALLVSALSAMIAFLVMSASTAAIGRGSKAQFIVSLALAGLACAALFPWLGVDKVSRRAGWQTMTRLRRNIGRPDLLKNV